MRRTMRIMMLGIGLAAAGACGEKSADSSAPPKQTRPNAKEALGGSGALETRPAGGSGQAAAPAMESAAPANGAASAASAGAIPLRDSTPDEAMETFLTRLQAADIAGAVEVCAPDAPGAAKLQATATGLANAERDGQDPKALAGFLLGDVKGRTFERPPDAGGDNIFVLKGPGKSLRFEAVKIGDAWRIIPPPEGVF